MDPYNPNQQIQVDMSDEIAQGTYSNAALISHSLTEFVIDFMRVMPGIQQAKVKSRIILTPEHAKRLLFALEDNINRFEQMNGKIKMGPDQGGGFAPPLGGMGQA